MLALQTKMSKLKAYLSDGIMRLTVFASRSRCDNEAGCAHLRETTTRVLASLTPREERVLRMRFGIAMNTDHTLEEVGQQA